VHLPPAESAGSTTRRQQPQPGTSPHQSRFSRSRDAPTGDIRLSGVADVLVGLGVQEHAAISGWIRSLVAAVVAVRVAVIGATDTMRAG